MDQGLQAKLLAYALGVWFQKERRSSRIALMSRPWTVESCPRSIGKPKRSSAPHELQLQDADLYGTHVYHVFGHSNKWLAAGRYEDGSGVIRFARWYRGTSRCWETWPRLLSGCIGSTCRFNSDIEPTKGISHGLCEAAL